MVPASASETQGGKKGVLVGLFTSLTTELQIQCMVLLLLKDSRLLVFIGWGGGLCGVTSTSLCTAKLISLFVFVLVIQQTALYLFSVNIEI
jgi:hypothetical protein